MISKPIPENEYKKILESMPVVCVEVIVCHNNRVLLVKRNLKPAKGKWWFPGGRVLKRERLDEAVKRKAYEETGLKININKKVGVYETIFDDGPFDDLQTGVHTVNIVFLTSLIKDQKIFLDEQSLGYKWIGEIEEDLDLYLKKALKDSKVFD